MDKFFVPSLGISLPRLGFGCMRLPADKEGNIQLQPALNLLHQALDAGVDYFDTAYVYHGGKAEDWLGKHFFSTLPRNSFMVATKLPVFRVKEAADCEKFFREQLANLRLDFIDFYLAHSIDKESWQRFKDLGGADFLLKLRKQGRARFIGFSFHGEPADLAGLLDDFPWDFVQLQINYYDWAEDIQNAKLQYETVAARKLPLLVMEPVRGGNLAQLPGPAMDLLRQHDSASSPASLALRWAGSLPAVSMVLSGMNTDGQLTENLDIFTDFQPLSAAEQQVVEQVRQILYAQPHVPCTACDYCKDSCPQGIAISDAFYYYNDYLRLSHESILENYLRFSKPASQPFGCTGCASCSPRCPQKIDIPAELARFNEQLEAVKKRA